MSALLIKTLCSTAAVALTFVAFVPYIRGIRQGSIQPHVFSWVIWGLTTCMVFVAQVQGHGGIGAWPIGISGAISAWIAWLAYERRTDITITPLDKLFLVAALACMPLWYATQDPLWAVIVLTTIDLLGFGPMIRKTYASPHSESMSFIALFVARNALVLIALAHYSVVTVLFPAAIGVMCLFVMALMAYRRSVLELRHA